MSIVIIPAYKPDKTLIMLADRLWDYGCRIIVVDDGSGEKYNSIFDKIKENCIVLSHCENRGKGAAIKSALAYVEAEMWDKSQIGIMDCDGQHLPEDMMKLLAEAGNHRDSLILGVRKVGKDMPLKSRFGNQITRMIFHMASGVKVSDTQTGLRAFDSMLLQEMRSIEGERYEYEMNVLMMLAKTGVPIREVPIHTIYRDKENSTSHFRVVWDSIRIYKDILKFTLSSLSSFILDYLLFTILMIFLPHTAALVLTANILARLISAFYNYSMNCSFVFHTEKKAATAVSYFGLAGFILVMNNLILEFLVQFCHVSVYPAKLVTECVLFLMSWLVQNYVIFRKERIILQKIMD